jgi:hypothetical protein
MLENIMKNIFKIKCNTLVNCLNIYSSLNLYLGDLYILMFFFNVN